MMTSSEEQDVDHIIPQEDFKHLQQISEKREDSIEEVDAPFSDKSRSHKLYYGSQQKHVDLLNSFLTQVNIGCNSNSLGDTA